MRIRLTPDQAEFLGLEVKEKQNGNARYYISEIQHRQIQEFKLGVIRTQTETDKIPLNDVKHLWHKTKDASYFITNPLYKSEETESFFDRLKSVISENKHKYPQVKRKAQNDAHLLIINPADIHLGKLATAFETGEDYNVQIAIQRVKDGVQGIIDKSSGFNIDKIIFVGGNDVLHIDTPRSTTTAGTFQDSDGMWYDNFLKAFKLYVEVLEMLIPVADVHFVYCPSNHDYTNGFFLCQTVEQYFRQNKNITFDCSIAHRKYYTYGLNLLGFTHGDGGRLQDLPLSMAHEAKDWSNCKHRYIFTHHLHHKVAKDYMGVCVETMRSPSGTDSWHHRGQYANNIKAVEGFLHHKEHGQTARFSHIF